MIRFKLDRLLNVRGMTQHDLVKITKIRPATISAYYYGFAKRLNVKDINKMCRILECNTCDLIEYVDRTGQKQYKKKVENAEILNPDNGKVE